jgi:hypothetical protein
MILRGHNRKRQAQFITTHVSWEFWPTHNTQNRTSTTSKSFILFSFKHNSTLRDKISSPCLLLLMQYVPGGGLCLRTMSDSTPRRNQTALLHIKQSIPWLGTIHRSKFHIHTPILPLSFKPIPSHKRAPTKYQNTLPHKSANRTLNC